MFSYSSLCYLTKALPFLTHASVRSLKPSLVSLQLTFSHSSLRYLTKALPFLTPASSILSLKPSLLSLNPSFPVLGHGDVSSCDDFLPIWTLNIDRFRQLDLTSV
jgi:hypothetical protein